MEKFTGTEKKVGVNIDIDDTSAKLHLKAGTLTSQVEFKCLSESDDGWFLTRDEVPKEIEKLSEER